MISDVCLHLLRYKHSLAKRTRRFLVRPSVNLEAVLVPEHFRANITAEDGLAVQSLVVSLESFFGRKVTDAQSAVERSGRSYFVDSVTASFLMLV